MASPRPQPTALKELRGNLGKRPLNKTEPKPALALPPCPDYLPPLAKVAWHELIPELARLGVITSIDINSFTRYCINLAEWRDCVDFLVANGPDLVVKDGDGLVKAVIPYPHTKRKREFETMLLRYEVEFGLTPSSRSKIHATPPEAKQGVDAVKDAIQAARMRIAN